MPRARTLAAGAILFAIAFAAMSCERAPGLFIGNPDNPVSVEEPADAPASAGPATRTPSSRKGQYEHA